VSKPIDREVLVATVARYLGRAIDSPSPEPVAMQRLCSTLAQDVDIAQFLPGFIADLPSMVNRLRAALEEENLEKLRGEIHHIKGTGGLYGLMPLTDAAERFEQAALDAQQVHAVRDRK